MEYSLRLTEAQHASLYAHLFPGDGLEAVALVLCGRRKGNERHILTGREVLPVPHDRCARNAEWVTWPTYLLDPFLSKAYGNELALLKVHSHPTGYEEFSPTDDHSDRTIFSSVISLLDDGHPHASAVMLPDGTMFGRIVGDSTIVCPLTSIAVIGDNINWWHEHRFGPVAGFALRHAQAFGKGTVNLLRSLSIAIVGCSGTGSIVVEQLARLGVGRLVLIDPDCVEEKNLNRILNAGKEDAYLSRPKVHVLASAIARMGLGTEVIPLQMNLDSRTAALAVAECDVVFGCMDGVEGRHLLNRLATYYLLPYFDVGVRLDADGYGGIDSIAGAVHYLQPGRSSLLSRQVYSMKRVKAEELRRTNPELYEREREDGYLRGVDEDRPAVISVNMIYGALVVNEFMARIHVFRNRPNHEFAYTGMSLSELQFYTEEEKDPCEVFLPYVGIGDVEPLLRRPSLS